MPLSAFQTQLGVAALAALIGFAAIYGTLGRPDNKSEPQGTEAVKNRTEDQGSVKRASGALAGFVFKKEPDELPDIAFAGPGGGPTSLKAFRGKVLLLNLWATWCVPCREEMPALDRLQKKLGSEDFEVVALAIDRSGIEGARKFFSDIKVETLKVYADPTTRSASALKAVGMPTTILIDKQGREIGRLPGPADWDTEEASQLIAKSLD